MSIIQGNTYGTSSAIPPREVPSVTITDKSISNEPVPLWGDDGLTFGDLIDAINPLQHIPIISNIYQKFTGYDASAGSKMLGGGLFGGFIGLATAFANITLKQATGKDAGDHVLALFSPEQPSEIEPGIMVAQVYGPPVSEDITHPDLSIMNDRQKELHEIMKEIPPALPDKNLSEQELSQIRSASYKYNSTIISALPPAVNQVDMSF